MLVAAAWAGSYRLEPKQRNDRQIAVQRMIHQLVALNDTVYDMSGTYVYRPRAHPFVFVDQARKIRYRTTLPAEVERALIAENLALMDGNRQKTAKVLRIGERTLYRKIKEYGL